MDRQDALDSVGKGWASMINKLYDAKPKEVEVLQVKEKYGTLRFYIGTSPDWYLDLISYYEDQSSKICENCGKPGETREKRGWLSTTCEECAKL